MSSRINQQDFLERDKLEVSSFLIYNKKYRELPNDAKLMYQYLLKRFSLTEHKMLEAMKDDNLEEFTFVDGKGDLFCVCSNDELRFVLGVSEKTVIKCKRALIGVNLLEEQKQTLHLSNRLYLNRVVMNLSDRQVFQIELKTFKEDEATKRKEKNKKRSTSLASSRKVEPQKLQFKESEKVEPQKLQFSELQNLQTSTKEYISTKELKVVNNIVNKEQLFEICNFYYLEFAVTRWTKKQWNTLIEQFVNELFQNKERLLEIQNIENYIRGCIKQMAHRYDLKNGRKPKIHEMQKSEKPLAVLPESYYYSWMDE